MITEAMKRPRSVLGVISPKPHGGDGGDRHLVEGAAGRGVRFEDHLVHAVAPAGRRPAQLGAVGGNHRAAGRDGALLVVTSPPVLARCYSPSAAQGSRLATISQKIRTKTMKAATPSAHQRLNSRS